MYKFMNTLPYFQLLFKVFTLVTYLSHKVIFLSCSTGIISIFLFSNFRWPLAPGITEKLKGFCIFSVKFQFFEIGSSSLLFFGPQKILGLNFNCQCFRTGEDNKRAHDVIHILKCRQVLQQSRKLGESQEESGKGVRQLPVSPTDVAASVLALWQWASLTERCPNGAS